MASFTKNQVLLCVKAARKKKSVRDHQYQAELPPESGLATSALIVSARTFGKIKETPLPVIRKQKQRLGGKGVAGQPGRNAACMVHSWHP